MSTLNVPIPMTVSCDNEAAQMNVGIKMTTGTTSVTDKAPYLHRASAAGSADVAVDKIVGGTFAWNQIVQNGNFANSDAWQSVTDAAAFSVSNNVGKLTITDNTKTGRPNLKQTDITGPVIGHKYLISLSVKISSSTLSSNASINALYGSNNSLAAVPPDEEWHDIRKIVNVSSKSYTFLTIYCSSLITAFANNDTIEYKNVYIIDLTAAFGSSIAEYLYTLESGSTGAGVNRIKSWGFCTKDYYPYNLGTLQSVNVSEHKIVGFNQWDEEYLLGWRSDDGEYHSSTAGYLASKNKIKVLPNTQYYIKLDYYSAVYICYYDADGNFVERQTLNASTRDFTTPSYCYYMHFNTGSAYGTTYNNDICINFNKTTGSPKNGDYRPYCAYSYALDHSKEFRGIPKLDANNNLYYDGDEYASDGTVTRKYKKVTLNGSETSGLRFTGVSEATTADGTKYVAYLPTSYDSSVKSGGYAVSSAFAWKSGILSTLRIGEFDTVGEYMRFVLTDQTITSLSAWQAYLSSHPLTIVCELATPTTETASGFTNPQNVDADGTEEYTDYAYSQSTRDVAIPVGHETQYVTRQTADVSVDAYPMTVTQGVEL